MHIDAIVDQLDLYMASIDKPVSVVEFGARQLPSSPYIVVKQNGGEITIVGHMLPGQQSALREMMYKDISDALEDQTVSDDDGNTTRLRAISNPGGLINDNDDGTISQDRLYQKADIIF